MKNKKFRQILSCIGISIISLIAGYTILMPNEKTEGANSPLAIMIPNGSGGYTKSLVRNFSDLLENYNYDHIDCGSQTESAKWTWNNGVLSAVSVSPHTKCTVYFANKPVPAFRVTTITVDGNQVSSVPNQKNYHVQPTCTGATASWNYETWSLDISSFSSTGTTCSLAFTTVTSSNLASLFTSDASSGKYLNTYIKSLLGGGTSVSAGESGNTLENLGTTVINPQLNDNPTWTPLSQSDYGTACYNNNCNSYTQLSDTYTFSDNKWSNTSAMSSYVYNRITIPSNGWYKLYWTNSNTSSSYKFYAYKPNSSTTATSGYNQTTEQVYDYGVLNAGDYIDILAKSSEANQITFYLVKTTDFSAYYHDIGIRYIGPNPNNYIKFNNELWRIIGIFKEAKSSALSDSDTYYTKIIRNESIGSYAYNGVSSNAGWWSKSDGSVSTLNYLLNHYYMGADNDNYNGTSDTTNCKYYSTSVTRNCDYRVIGIQPGWRDMVINTTWYTAGIDSSTASTSFSGERGSTAGPAGGELSYKDTINNKYSKVGLMYPSDYLYSGSSASNRWLLQNGGEWTISPSSSYASNAWTVLGLSYMELSNYGAYTVDAVRPTVYLSSGVYITGGSGTILDPYIVNGPSSSSNVCESVTVYNNITNEYVTYYGHVENEYCVIYQIQGIGVCGTDDATTIGQQIAQNTSYTCTAQVGMCSNYTSGECNNNCQLGPGSYRIWVGSCQYVR